MRELGFDVSFRPAAAEQMLVVVHVGKDFAAQELIEDGIIDASIGYFVEAIAASKGMQSQYRLAPVTTQEIHVTASRAVLDQPWHIAAILNLLDGATFLGQEDDAPFIARVEVAEPQTLEALYQNLGAYMDACRAAMDAWMPKDTEIIDGSVDHRWPTPAPEYMFDVVMYLSAPLPAGAQAQLTQFLEQMDQVMAESAFEAETSPDEWFDEGMVPYPVEFEVKSQEITYGIEMPPTDVAPILLMLMTIMQRRYDVSVTTVAAEIREGW